MKDWAPNWHLSIAMGGQSRVGSFNDFSYPLVRELSATSSRDLGQVRNWVLQGTGCWSVPSSIRSMTRGAMTPENLRSYDAVTLRRGRPILFLSCRQESYRQENSRQKSQGQK
jgi:hypothetical protein